MLGSPFIEASLLFTLAAQLFTVWSVHFAYLRRSRSRYLNFKDKAQALARNLASQEQPQAFPPLYLYLGVLTLLVFRSLSCEPQAVLFKQVALEEAGLALFSLSIAFTCLLSLFLLLGSGQRRGGGVGQDFFTSAWLLSLLSPLAFLSNNLLCFFLLLEVTSASSMYMLVSSRGSFAGSRLQPRLSRQMVSTLFFHFWSSFFSSVLLVYSIVALLSCFGTTEWSYLDALLSLSTSSGSGPASPQCYIASYALTLAILIKLGASPFFFFKLEVYKGLPLLPLVFYSVFYFFSYTLVFFFLLAYLLPSVLSLVTPGLALLLLASVAYLGASLFSLPLLRSFFALSSAIGCALALFLLLCFFF